MCTLVLWESRHIPTLDTSKNESLSHRLESSQYQNFYFRGDFVYNTQTLQLGNLVYYVTVCTLGHFYVIISNLNLYAGSIFYAENSEIRDLVKTICFAPFIFFFSTVICLRG